jgi:pyrroloquinoline quinone biosynthesis protein D
MQASEPLLSLHDTPVIARGVRLQWEAVPQAYVLLYPEGRVQLNGSAAEIMQRVDGKRSIAAITQELERAFNETDLLQDVLASMALALSQGWIEVAHAA